MLSRRYTAASLWLDTRRCHLILQFKVFQIQGRRSALGAITGSATRETCLRGEMGMFWGSSELKCPKKGQMTRWRDSVRRQVKGWGPL